MKNKLEIKLATIEHAREYYGQYDKSFKGYVGLLNDKVVGIVGLSYEKGKIVLFSDIKDEIRPYKKGIVKAIKLIQEMIQGVNYPILAIASCKEMLSEKILSKLGFTTEGHLLDDDKIYWRLP